MALTSSDPAAIYEVLDQDAHSLISPSLTLVQSRQEAGHSSNKLQKGPAFRLLGLVQTKFDDIYDKEETLDKLKPRLATLIGDGAVFPENTSKAESGALREAVQVAVDACEVAEAVSIDERRANLLKLEQLASDDKNHDKGQTWWRAKTGSLDVTVNKGFTPVGGSTNKGPRKKDGWCLAVKELVTLRRDELAEEEKEDRAAEAAKAAHRDAAYAVYKAAHEAAATYEKVQRGKARDAGGSALRDRLWARAEAKANANHDKSALGGTNNPLETRLRVHAKLRRLRRKNMWTHYKYDYSRYAHNNNYPDYCEKGREPAGCYDAVDDWELCTGGL